jgi:hypothetical protein
MTDTRSYREIGVSRDGFVATHLLQAAAVRRRQIVATSGSTER